MRLARRLGIFLALLFIPLALLVVAVQARSFDEIVIDATERRLEVLIRSAWTVLEHQQALLSKEAELVAAELRDEEAAEATPLLAERASSRRVDLLALVDAAGTRALGPGGEVALGLPGLREALARGHSLRGFAVVPAEDELVREALVPEDCPPAGRDRLLLIFAARPLGEGRSGAMVAARTLNCAHGIVERIEDNLFEDRIVEGNRLGTATIFLDDTRVATTVLDEEGRRAIGTRASREVIETVIERGEPWSGPAMVLNERYLARYEPIRNPEGAVIGMLYIGELEKVLLDARRRALLASASVMLTLLGVALVASVLFARPLLRQVRALHDATSRFAEGGHDARAAVLSRDEVGELAASFNRMAQTIEQERAEIVAQRERIEALNRNYIDMLGFISHEMRSTLGSALFNVQLLEEEGFGELSEDVREGVGLVAGGLRHLDDLTREYLQLARLEAGELVVNRSEVRVVEDAIKPVIEGLGPQLEARGQRIAIDVDESLVVPADARMLRVVYENLIGNAVRYGSEGGLIELGASVGESEVTLSVFNEGPAVPLDRLPTLFRRFERMDLEEKTGREGSGLGLFIVSQIVSGHGGKVWAEAVEGPHSGTRFLFTLST